MKDVLKAQEKETGYEADIFEDTARSHRSGNGNTFPLGQPAVNGAGIQSNRSARAKGAIDHQEQSKRRSTRCADTGTAGANRSRAVGAGAASQRESTNSSDGDSGTGGIGECTNRPGERGARVGEVLWPTADEVWHGAGEPGAGRGIECGVARGPRAAVGRSRIAERAHQGIRRADGANRQGELPASRAAQTGEGGRNADRADVCPDSGRSVWLPKESRGRLFSRVAPWAPGPRRKQAADAHQQ